MLRPLLLLSLLGLALVEIRSDQGRRPADDVELRFWLENMILDHRYSMDEVRAATGMTDQEVWAAMVRFGLPSRKKEPRAAGEPLRVRPYPGGRHPRIGFLDGAVDPQRETKLSIFFPSDPESYVVADVPEAIWSNLGLTYLAHTHVPTIWTKQNVTLPRLEWERMPNGDWRMERTLPNGIRFGTQAHSTPEALLMKMWLSNGTSEALSDLRVQNCVMLKGAAGFNQQTNSNKVLRGSFAACRSDRGDRWVITAWKPIQRSWANAPVPCLHADPKFPDAKPGETKVLHGLVSFYEGTAIDGEFERIERNWDQWMRSWDAE